MKAEPLTTCRWFFMATWLLAFTAAAADSGKAVWKFRAEPAAGITAAAQPTANGLRELAESGYAAVIDLRTAGEDRGLDEQAIVEDLGMEYVALPIAGRDDLTFEKAGMLDQILRRYERPVLIHCGTGNRVGALLALREKKNGAADEDALAFGRSAGMTSLEDAVRTLLAED